jgi:hypothetical protein
MTSSHNPNHASLEEAVNLKAKLDEIILFFLSHIQHCLQWLMIAHDSCLEIDYVFYIWRNMLAITRSILRDWIKALQ